MLVEKERVEKECEYRRESREGVRVKNKVKRESRAVWV